MRALLALEYELFAFGHVRGWNALETHVTSFQAPPMRATLAVERNRRACAVAKDPTSPIFDLECP